MTIPSAYAIVANSFTGRTLNMAVAGITASSSIGSGIGFLFGGAFYSTSVGYRGMFYLFAGLAFLASSLSFLLVKKTMASPAKISKLDHCGVFLMLGGALLLVTGLTEGGEHWDSPKAYVPIIVGVLMLIAFLLWEKRFYNQFNWSRSSELLIPKELWMVPNFIPLILVLGMNFGSMFIQVLVNVDIYQYVSHHSAIISALQALPGPVSVFVSTFALGATFGKVPPKYAIFVGNIFNVVSGVLLSRQGADTHSYWRFGFVGLIILGVGTSLTFINTLNTLVVSCPLNLQGLLSGTALTTAQMFVAAGSAALSSIVGSVELVDTVEERHKLLKRYRDVYYLSIALAGLAIIVTFFVKNLPITPPAEDANSDVESGKKAEMVPPSLTEVANHETEFTSESDTNH
ncbi:unnamed protein product [Kuraishia capsulata CBS 1993]|uniref:Major facilitator superfamily (MFS) profile domain-containing protein n=1 Tax=Kuraishia capsulata CBS 1993 TaxID=1382522 RepID=W6MQC1_9ASCO|nr:uncharacterized protein KUCA_T00004930001 [Kuraishia capsulata CBS 1993]CDK28944.1 unnamed protein product [Kuraishia capsulata CBS 1993]